MAKTHGKTKVRLSCKEDEEVGTLVILRLIDDVESILLTEGGSPHLSFHFTLAYAASQKDGFVRCPSTIACFMQNAYSFYASAWRQYRFNRCVVHIPLNVTNAMPHRERKEVATEIAGIWQQEKIEDGC